MQSIEQVVTSAANAAFGKPLVTNVFRGLIAEAIIADALTPDWTWCSTDYAAWDFERPDGTRLEVKQSALRQSWHVTQAAPSTCRFDIATRKGRYDGATYIQEERRWADVYVFALHNVVTEAADHRDPRQWCFYVVLTKDLPAQKTIGLTGVQKLAECCDAFALLAAVDRAVSEADTATAPLILTRK